MDKLTSRKFWICVAAMLASIATSISGITTANQTVTIIGTICGIASAAIYAFCEAWVDGKAVNQNTVDAIITMLSNADDNDEEDKAE